MMFHAQRGHATTLHQDLADAVTRGLGRAARREGPGRWNLRLPRAGRGQAYLDGVWLCFQLPWGSAGDAWDLVRQNAALPGNVKFVRRGTASSLHLEVRIQSKNAHDETRLALAQLRAVVSGRAVDARKLDAFLGSTSSSAATTSSATTTETTLLDEVLHQTGWEAIARDDGSCSVPVTVRRVRHEIRVRVSQGVVATLEITRLGALPLPQRQAVAGLLLDACFRVRGAKAVLESHDGHHTVACFRACVNERTPEAGVAAVESVITAAELAAAECVSLARHAEIVPLYLWASGQCNESEVIQGTRQRLL